VIWASSNRYLFVRRGVFGRRKSSGMVEAGAKESLGDPHLNQN